MFPFLWKKLIIAEASQWILSWHTFFWLTSPIHFATFPTMCTDLCQYLLTISRPQKVFSFPAWTRMVCVLSGYSIAVTEAFSRNVVCHFRRCLSVAGPEHGCHCTRILRIHSTPSHYTSSRPVLVSFSPCLPNSFSLEVFKNKFWILHLICSKRPAHHTFLASSFSWFHHYNKRIIPVIKSFINKYILQIFVICDIVVRVSGYRSRGPGFDSRPY
jgi:hypothetical protein